MMSAAADEKRTRLEKKKRLLRWVLKTPGCQTKWHFDFLAKIGISWGGLLGAWPALSCLLFDHTNATATPDDGQVPSIMSVNKEESRFYGLFVPNVRGIWLGGCCAARIEKDKPGGCSS
jgi:hypothetical protein